MPAVEQSTSSDPVRPSLLVSEGDPHVTELRLALVCFGGVSLAVYMHGITKEVHSLLRASRAFDAALAIAGTGDPSPDGLPVEGTERAYFSQLVELWRAGVPTTATVDIVTGTSAGGINGICLAQAVVCGSGQDSLTQLWMDKGDIGGLMRYGFLGQHLGELATALVMPWKAGSDWSPLKGDDMCRWLFGALADMESVDKSGAAKTLLPDGGTLDLYVTATDLHGTDQVLAVGAGGGLHDRTYHRVFEFHYEPPAAGAVSLAASRGGSTINTIGKGHSWPLAFAARATSCFPGAFPPISLADYAEAVAKLPANTGEYNPDRFAALFMPEYRLLPNGNPAKAYMMDGGVLDNAPFDHAIAAIASKPAGREVVRHLIFIEPDPGDASPGADVDHLAASDADQSASGEKPPTWAAGIWAALSTIPHHQPLLNSVRRLADVNDQVATIGRVTRELEDDVMAHLARRGVTVAPDAVAMTFDQLKATAKTVYDAVPALVGDLNYRTYGRLKMQAIAERLARDLAAQLTYPPTSSQAGFLRAAMIAWVHAQPAWSDTNSDEVQRWLGPLDVPYRERRLEFIITGVNELFEQETRARVAKDDAGPTPSREQLARLKQAAWTLLLDERAKPGVAIKALDNAVTDFAANAALGQHDLLVAPAEWAQIHTAQIGAMVDAYRAEIGKLTADSAMSLWTAFRQAVDGWDSGPAQSSIIGRFVGFPLWDALLFPVQSLSRLPLFNPIHATRFSPVDATALKPSTPGKLEGVATHHFGAFFTLERRQNDYLWGRLDGAELLLQLLRRQYTGRIAADGPPLPAQAEILTAAATAVLDQESAQLKHLPDRIAGLRAQLPVRP